MNDEILDAENPPKRIGTKTSSGMTAPENAITQKLCQSKFKHDLKIGLLVVRTNYVASRLSEYKLRGGTFGVHFVCPSRLYLKVA